ncbi:MAG: MaoC family dehydratase [Beutenbergiaceae bacterium]
MSNAAMPTVSDTFTFRKTIAESDVYLFAGITGDLSPNHVDAEYMRGTPYGRRVAHGALTLSLASNASTQVQAAVGRACVSYGYDRVRFIAPVFIGDTVSVQYRIDHLDIEAQKSYGAIEIRNTDGQLCMVATHILKFL